MGINTEFVERRQRLNTKSTKKQTNIFKPNSHILFDHATFIGFQILTTTQVNFI